MFTVDYIATWLATNYSLGHVGYYLMGAALITLVCLLLSNEEEVSG
ncbi:hypothetical protein GOL95_28100 [Sinorhizobium medicae]|nr:hypothetical protein [Sinorhizobium medicae]MDX1243814.1 hypothetical protein [Sinorhizobium medicae]